MALARKADLKLKAGETSITHLKAHHPIDLPAGHSVEVGHGSVTNGRPVFAGGYFVSITLIFQRTPIMNVTPFD